ncbi:MAG TPA: MFS transporter, partial [Pseudolabrys sp.]|nr:MFS transporter [Pseudolabrys sp.]
MAEQIVETDIPARLDRLPWGRFHRLVVAALGITWILDGLEVTLAGALSGALKASPVLQFSNTDIGIVSSVYLVGAVLGALFFGWLTDRLGRKKLFFITLSVYLIATAATAASWNLASFAVFRFFTGAGIGGEYAAINSTIQEIVPARVRGWTDLVINGSFWIGAALGSLGSLVLLDPAIINPEHGWRFAFLIGAALALVIFFMRLWIPESPRWLMTHGHAEEAERVVAGIEAHFDALPPADSLPRVRLRTRHTTPLGEVLRALFVVHRQRALVGLALMASQAFFYNAIFFTYALILTDFYSVPADNVGWYLLPFAAGNFMGPVLIGRFFDTLGRRVMIAFTYIVSGVLLAIVGYLFMRDIITAETQTIGWMVIFFFASAAASSAYLTVSETFPLETRAFAIAIFYAVGTGVGGVAGPLL